MSFGNENKTDNHKAGINTKYSKAGTYYPILYSTAKSQCELGRDHYLAMKHYNNKHLSTILGPKFLSQINENLKMLRWLH